MVARSSGQWTVARVSWIYAVGICLAFLIALACSSKERLNLRISMVKSPHSVDPAEYVLGDEIECLVVLENEMRSPVVVNKRLSIAHPGSPFKEVVFLITDPGGAQLEFREMFMYTGPATSKDFEELKPGDAVRAVYDLQGWYLFTGAGTYTIQAVYENHVQPASGDAWEGTIKSNTVTLTVK